MQSFRGLLILVFLALASAPALFAKEAPSPDPPANYLFRNQFYLSPSQKARQKLTEADGFLIAEQASPEWNSKVAVVSGFAPEALRTQALKDIQTVDQAKEWIHTKKRSLFSQGVPILELPFTSPDGQVEKRYWVGNKSFNSYDRAAAEIAMVRSLIEIQGGDFDRAQKLAQEFVEKEEAPPAPEVKSEAQFKKEEEIALRWSDQLGIGEDLFGSFQGVPAGEPILYQSFGETTWRSTNFVKNRLRAQVGYWTNRMVFKGIRFPFNTIDFYVEVTAAMESTGNDGGNQLDTIFGAEWRPLARNYWLENFKPWGIPLLKFAKNYRFYVQYMDRRNLKDEIANIRDFDTRFGVDIFYEWGIELTPLDQAPGKGFAGFLTDYTWGEYYANYGWRDTNFTTEQIFDAWMLDNSLILGLKTKPIPVPQNRVIENIVLMPYFRLALTSNTKLSNPSDNRYYVSVGVRWMPFRSYRFVNNEWLLKTKIFAEYIAIGKANYLRQADDKPRPKPDQDWRIGIAWSLRRF